MAELRGWWDIDHGGKNQDRASSVGRLVETGANVRNRKQEKGRRVRSLGLEQVGLGQR